MQECDFFSNDGFLAVAVTIVCYLFLFTEKLNRAVATLFAAALMIVCGVLTQDEALQGIDFNTVFLLTGMMIIVNITEKTGLFQYIAVWGAKKVQAKPLKIMAVLALATACFSAFLDNVTTVLLIVPITLKITRKLKVNSYPYLILEIFASNIGGTATLIGDPPNILIGSALNLSFMDFIVNLTPVVLMTIFLLTAAFVFMWRKSVAASPENELEVMQMNEKEMIKDQKLLIESLFILISVILGFISAEYTGIANGTIALCGAAFLLMMYAAGDKAECDGRTAEILSRIDWTTILFFCGLFMIVHGLEVTGILNAVGQWLSGFSKGNLQRTTFLILGVSALFSSVIDNIPFVATMIPILKTMAESTGGNEAMLPVWWALALGSCFGGNGTLIGASANVIVAGMAQKEGMEIHFGRFLLWSVPVTILTVMFSGIYIYVRYFMF